MNTRIIEQARRHVAHSHVQSPLCRSWSQGSVSRKKLSSSSFDKAMPFQLGYSSLSYCLDRIETGSLSLLCPNNELIKLGRVIYGYSWSDDCSYIDKDCTMDVPREDILCLTISSCTVRVVQHPLILQDCWNLAASYVQAEYECVKGKQSTELKRRPSIIETKS